MQRKPPPILTLHIYSVKLSFATCEYIPRTHLHLSCADLDRLRDDRVMVYTQRAQWR